MKELNYQQIPLELQEKLKLVLEKDAPCDSSEDLLIVCKGEWGIQDQATERAIAQTRSEFFSTSQYKTAPEPKPKKVMKKRKQKKVKKLSQRTQSLDESRRTESRVKPSKYFGIVDKARTVTSNIAEAIGGRSATQIALKSSINDMRDQFEVSKQSIMQERSF